MKINFFISDDDADEIGTRQCKTKNKKTVDIAPNEHKDDQQIKLFFLSVIVIIENCQDKCNKNEREHFRSQYNSVFDDEKTGEK